MPSLNHVHTYKKFSKDLFQCADPYCTHKMQRSMIVGKVSLCNGCRQEFILTKEAMKRALPKCVNCMQTKEAIEFREQRKRLQEVMSLFQEDKSGGPFENI